MDQESRHSLAGSSAQGLTRLHSLVECRVLCQAHVVIGQIYFPVILWLSSFDLLTNAAWRQPSGDNFLNRYWGPRVGSELPETLGARLWGGKRQPPNARATRWSNQSILKEISPVFIGRIDAEAETPILWPPDVKNWLIGNDPDAGKDWRQEEKGTTEDEMVGWHHQLYGHEFE